ncbi:hypothetical protein Tco_1426229, partial [Tanacetum coccineum]
FVKIVDFVRGSNLRYAFTTNPTIHDSLVKQFWQTATAKTLADRTLELHATIDTIAYTITEASIRNKLQLADASRITMLPNNEIFEGMGHMGYPTYGSFTFYKSFFTPQWRFLDHHILHYPLVSLVQELVTPSKTVNASEEEQVEDISPTTLEAVAVLTKVKKIKSVDKGKRYKRRRSSKESVGTGLDFEEVKFAFEEVNTGGIKVSAGIEEINAGSLDVNTSSDPVTTDRGVLSLPSTDRGRREVAVVRRSKAPMTEEEETQASRKTKEQILQEDRNKRKKEAQVQFEAPIFTEEDWDTIRAKLEANTELKESRSIQEGTHTMTQTQLRNYMSNFQKNQGTWKLTQLKKLNFEEVKAEFEKLVKQLDTYVPMNFEATKESLKRFGEELQTKTAKKLKFDDESTQQTEEKVKEDKDDKPTKKTGNRRK